MLNSHAPEFSLQSTTGRELTLSHLRGAFVILIFYPANDTPTCSKQLDEMNLNLDQMVQLNTTVFGVNTAKQEKSKSFCVRRRLEFPILSDPGGKVAQSYGARMGWLPYIKRTVVAICPKGTIIFYEHGNPPAEKVVAAIKNSYAIHKALGTIKELEQIAI